ncbi:MAG: hypothetical protein K0Q87_1609 [Neobacillus sp.]|nr:hypothetical protein [Neobacillus sp.]
MSRFEDYKMTRHICPRNCYGACGMVAYTKNGVLENIKGDPDHEFTKGRICPKGYNYIKRVYHQDRIKYPLLQEKRGSGKWKRITWEYAIDVITDKILELHARFESNLSICLNKYSGNMGVLHNSVEVLFSSLGGTTRVVGDPCWSAGADAQYYDFGNHETSDPTDMQYSKLIILWGANPAWTAVHNLPYIYKAQENGAKVIVIDPVRTTTAKKADIYIQIKPGGDGALALAIAKILIESKSYNQQFIKQYVNGWEEYKSYVSSLDLNILSEDSGISLIVINELAKLIGSVTPMFIWIGFGMQRHTNGGQNIRAINALAALTGNIGSRGSGVNYAHNPYGYFNSTSKLTNEKDRQIDINEFSTAIQNEKDPPLKFLWVSCRNFMSQDPQNQKIQSALKNLEMIVTVDHFLTPTALQSDIVLPATTHFEEEDIVPAYWHHYIGINQKAIEPYFQSKSDLEIAKLLSSSLNKKVSGFCQFPTYSTTSDFIEKEFNERLYQSLSIDHWRELEKKPRRLNVSKTARENLVFQTPSQKFELYSETAKTDGHTPIVKYIKGLTPNIEYPFWLLTTHSLEGLNSQFREEGDEPHLFVDSIVLKQKQIEDGSMVILYNELGEIQVKVSSSNDLAPDILLFYQGWYPKSGIHINSLVPGYQTDMGKASTGARGIAFHDTFVNIKKS